MRNIKQSTINSCPKFRVSLLCHLQESDETIDKTLKRVRHLFYLTNEDMDPIDAQIEDLPNHDLFEKLIDPGSKVLEVVSREVVKKCPSFRVLLYDHLQ